MFKKILTFLNVLEADSVKLSLTNIFVLGIVIKVLLIGSVTIEDVALASLAFANYVHKRHIKSKYVKEVPIVTANVVDLTPLEEELKDLKSKFSSLSTMVGFRQIGKKE